MAYRTDLSITLVTKRDIMPEDMENIEGLVDLMLMPLLKYSGIGDKLGLKNVIVDFDESILD